MTEIIVGKTKRGPVRNKEIREKGKVIDVVKDERLEKFKELTSKIAGDYKANG